MEDKRYNRRRADEQGSRVRRWAGRLASVPLAILAAAALALPAPAGLDAGMFAAAVYFWAAVLLPFNILVFSLPREKGLLSPAGRGLLGFLLAQLAAAVLLTYAQDADVAGFVSRDSLALGGYTPLPRTAVALFALAAAVLGVRMLRRRSPVDGAMFYVLFALTAALHFRGEATAVPLFFAAAATMLTGAAIQDSRAVAYRDELTGLPSRRSLQEEMARLGDRYVIAMVDIDHFKKLNDRFGHDVGDDVLRMVAALLMEVPGGGRAFRYGGEEFTVVFPGLGLEEALPCLEDVRSRVAGRKFVVRGTKAAKRVAVTVSVGAAAATGRALPAEVLKAADEALYRAKEEGRNRVCV